MADDNSNKSELARVAHHEAGHAVAAIEFRIPFKYVTIDPALLILGHCALSKARNFRPDYSVTRATQLRAERYIVTCYAGLTAEAKYTGIWNFEGSEHDLKVATTLASQVCGSFEEVEAFLNWMMIRNKQLWTWEGDPGDDLDNPFWGEVRAVAEQLLAGTTLSNRQVRVIAASVS